MTQGTTLFARLASLYESLETPQERFADCHLVAIVGLMSRVITMIAWALCEIVADSELTASPMAEINAIVDDTMPGLSALSRDPNVIVKCRKKIIFMHVIFDNVSPNW